MIAAAVGLGDGHFEGQRPCWGRYLVDALMEFANGGRGTAVQTNLIHHLRPPPAFQFGQHVQPAGVNRFHLSRQTTQLALGHLRALPGHVAPDVVHLLVQPLHQALVGFFLQPPALLPLHHVGAVVAPIGNNAPSAHFPDGVDHPVQKITVVADKQQSPGPALKRTLQPLNGAHVQMVGRLVEDEQVGLFQQQPGQQQPRLLATAQVSQGHGPVGLVKTEAG